MTLFGRPTSRTGPTGFANFLEGVGRGSNFKSSYFFITDRYMHISRTEPYGLWVVITFCGLLRSTDTYVQHATFETFTFSKRKSYIIDDK